MVYENNCYVLCLQNNGSVGPSSVLCIFRGMTSLGSSTGLCILRGLTSVGSTARLCIFRGLMSVESTAGLCIFRELTSVGSTAGLCIFRGLTSVGSTAGLWSLEKWHLWDPLQGCVPFKYQGLWKLALCCRSSSRTPSTSQPHILWHI